MIWIVLAVTSVSTSQGATEWSTTDSLISDGYFVDANTFGPLPNDLRKIRVLHPKTRPTSDYDFDINTYEFDCVRRTGKIVEAIVYDAQGQLFTEFDPKEKFEPVKSRTLENEILQTACEGETLLSVAGDAASVVRKWRAIDAQRGR